MIQSFLEFPSWISPMVIPGIPILRWYGLMYVINIIIVYSAVLREIRAKEKFLITENDHFNIILWGIIGTVICARLFSVFIYDTSGIYLARPWLAFWPFDESGNFVGLQGMSYHGGIVGAFAGIIICLVVMQKQRVFLEYADWFFAIFPLAYTFGRLGNFINGELYGRITTASFGMRFPTAELLPISNPHIAAAAEKFGLEANSDGMVNIPRHASQLYEAFLEGILLWLFLWFIIRKKKTFHGYLICWYLIGYGVARFIAEYFRQPDEGMGFVIQLTLRNNPNWLLMSPWNITMGQILCALMIIAGTSLFFILRHRHLSEPSIQTYKKPAALKSRKIHQKIKKIEKKK